MHKMGGWPVQKTRVLQNRHFVISTLRHIPTHHTTMIQFREVSKTYVTQHTRTHALKSVNLRVEAGEIFGIVGPSGSGKSTLIRCANLLERPTTGSVVVNGQVLTGLTDPMLRAARRRIAMIFQHFHLLETRTVYQNIAFPLEISGKSRPAIAKKLKALLEITGLGTHQNHYPCHLSGGQKQRVAIARALANDPLVLLSDEATSSLDPETTQDILQLLKTINQDLNVTILLITHRMQVIKDICHRLAMLSEGKIIGTDCVLHFFTNPKTAIAKKFVRDFASGDLPEALRNRLVKQPEPKAQPVWKLSFIGGNTSGAPLVSYLSRTFSLDLNILQARIEHIQDQSVGLMLITVSGDPENIQRARQYLKAQNIYLTEIAYVKHAL